MIGSPGSGAEGRLTAGGLTGNYWVRRLNAAAVDAGRYFPRATSSSIRRHVLKLRYWPAPHATEPSGRAVDLDWSYIRGLPGLDVGELRIDDEIGGQRNIRIIFFVGPTDSRYPMTCIWVLTVFPKKRDDFTSQQLDNFRDRRRIVLARFYGPSPRAARFHGEPTRPPVRGQKWSRHTPLKPTAWV